MYNDNMESLERMIDERITWGDMETVIRIKWLLHDLNVGVIDKMQAIGSALDYQVAGAKGIYKTERRQYAR